MVKLLRAHRQLAIVLIAVCVHQLSVTPGCADLVGWWTFDGNADDQSGFENHGELFDGDYSDDVPAALGNGQSLSLEDDSAHVFVEADESLDSEVFTVSMFILDRGQEGALERLTSRDGDTLELAINVHPPFDGNGQYAFYSPGSGWLWGDFAPEVDEWTHVAYVADGESMSIYSNGELVVDEMPFVSTPSGFMHIGNRWNDVEGFEGQLDDVAIWDEALDAATIAALAAGTQRPGAGGGDGDYNNDGMLGPADMDLLSAAVRAGGNELGFDANGDGAVDGSDRTEWIEVIANSYFGDSNFDGVFDSSDLVTVFTAGEYEDTSPINSTWATGDWNGDQEFNSSDLVTAFSAGGYDTGQRVAAAAVPEPATPQLLVLGLLSLVAPRARRPACVA